MTASSRLALATALAGALALPAAAQVAAPDAEVDAEQRPARFIDREGNEVGTANIADAPAGGALIDIQVEGLPREMWLGFHIHETGDCDPATEFESAGDHYDPDGAQHGYFAEGGPHAGDMPNQFVPANGLLRSQVFNHMVSLEGENSLRGRALVIHDQADDYESQPSGESGERLVCAVIE